MERQYKRGNVHWVDFGITDGSEQGGVRPAVIIQNDIGNKYSPTLIVCPISSEIKKKELPTHVYLNNYKEYGLTKPSQVITEQIRTIDKSKVGDYIGYIDETAMLKVSKALEVSVQIGGAKNIYEPREVKIIKDKVKYIEEIDSFIRMWLMKNNDVTAIKDYLIDREIMIKDLELYASKYNLDYKKMYNPMMYNSDVRMVG